MSDGNALSYRYNNGGLNNQKLALLGLFLEATSQGRPLVLPDLYNLDHVDDAERCASRLDDFYDVSHITELLQRYHVGLVAEADLSDDRDIGGWNFFATGAKHIAIQTAEGKMKPSDMACDFFRSLIPTARSQPEVVAFQNRLKAEGCSSLVVQLRIEKDWQTFSQITLQPTVGDTEDYLPSFSDIIAKVVNTLGDRCHKVYIVCDEAALPVSKDEIRQVCLKVFGVSLFWKSDFLPMNVLDRMSVLERSILDFDVAVQAQSFVGLTRSSFSNLVTFERYCMLQQTVRDHYIYNIRGPYVVERHDNGAFAFPSSATA